MADLVPGSGGMMSDLTFNGGATGASMGNQQYTMRNLVFNNCGTGRLPHLAYELCSILTMRSDYPIMELGLDIHKLADQQLWQGYRYLSRRF